MKHILFAACSLFALVTCPALTAAATAAQDSPVLTCTARITQSNGRTFDGDSKTAYPEFFRFSIDPALGAGESWLFQNLCLSRKDITGANFRGDVCLLVYNSGPGPDGGAPQSLFVDLIHQGPKPSKRLPHMLGGLPYSHAANVTAQFPPTPFSVELNSYADNLSQAQVECTTSIK